MVPQWLVGRSFGRKAAGSNQVLEKCFPVNSLVIIRTAYAPGIRQGLQYNRKYMLQPRGDHRSTFFSRRDKMHLDSVAMPRVEIRAERVMHEEHGFRLNQ